MIRNSALRALALGLAAASFLSFGAGAASIEELARLQGPEREKVLIEGARAEGKVVMYSAMIENQALRPINEAFHRKYPFIEAEFWRADTRDLINKTLAEARARAMVVDIVEGGGVSQSLVRAGVTQAFDLPGAKALNPSLVDSKGMWVATRVSYFGLAYNTKLVSEADAPKTYQDLLDPKWRGKMAWAASTETGGAMMFISFIRAWLGEEKGEAYLQELGKQDVANLSGSPREVVNKVMAGEYPLALSIFLHHPVISALQGAPVAPRPMEPVLGNASVMVLMKNAPHPHAALLLMDFLLSKEGQTVIKNADYFPADSSIEVEKTVAGIVPANNGLAMQMLSEEDLFAGRTKSLALQKQYFQKR